MAISTHETRFILTAKDKTKGVLKSTKMQLKDVGKAVTGVHAQLLGLAGIGGMGALVSGIVGVNREMQTLKSSLKTVTGGSEEANKAFEKIQHFAVTTPFDLNNWTQAFIKMKALGLDPSEAALTSYGNTAAAMGKDLNQMIEAVADAATGEFERLKEFGIKAKKEGEEVSFTFQGVTTTIGNNAKEIEGYLQSIGNNQFGGAMADQMNNLGPAFSNLGQAFQTLAVKIGEAGLNDMVIGLTRSITEMVNSFSDTQAHTISQFFTGVGESLKFIWKMITLITDGWGKIIGGVGSLFIPDSGISGSVPGGYQLGDFNRSGGSLQELNRLRDVEAGLSKDTLAAMKENNNWQKQIVEAIRENNNVAVAG